MSISSDVIERLPRVESLLNYLAPMADKPMNLEGDMLVTFFTALIGFTLLFLGLLAFRYGLERSQAQLALRVRRERSA